MGWCFGEEHLLEHTENAEGWGRERERGSDVTYLIGPNLPVPSTASCAWVMTPPVLVVSF